MSDSERPPDWFWEISEGDIVDLEFFYDALDERIRVAVDVSFVRGEDGYESFSGTVVIADRFPFDALDGVDLKFRVGEETDFVVKRTDKDSMYDKVIGKDPVLISTG